MPISRLRLELAAWFAAAMLVAVSAVDAGLTVYLRREAATRFSIEVEGAAAGLLRAVRQEEKSGAATLEAVTDALAEWPASQEAFVVYAQGAAIGVRGAAELVGLAPPQPPESAPLWTRARPTGGAARLALARDRVQPPLTVVAIRPTTELTEYAEVLTGWLMFSIPGVTVFALVAGYFLARRALRPLNATADRIAAIDPSDLAGRLPVRTPPDEIDRLAQHFNALLTRLADLRQQNRDFLSRAAHQLKTPLTLVRGESELGLERERDVEAYRAILGRIGRAADQMTHRVDDLFLLARAEAGDQPPLTDAIELDGPGVGMHGPDARQSAASRAHARAGSGQWRHSPRQRAAAAGGVTRTVGKRDSSRHR
jgi:methyl-accepting chemotaxis protein